MLVKFKPGWHDRCDLVTDQTLMEGQSLGVQRLTIFFSDLGGSTTLYHRLGNTRAYELVAAHAWDVTGAIRAGCAAAFIARPGMVLDPLAPKPDIIGKDLREVAAQILAVEKS